jgi:hypothetical protein
LAAQKREEQRRRMEAIEIKCTEFDQIEIDSFDGNLGSNWNSITKESIKLGKANDTTKSFSDIQGVKEFLDQPEMKQIEVYHDGNFIQGLRVEYFNGL